MYGTTTLLPAARSFQAASSLSVSVTGHSALDLAVSCENYEYDRLVICTTSALKYLFVCTIVLSTRSIETEEQSEDWQPNVTEHPKVLK